MTEEKGKATRFPMTVGFTPLQSVPGGGSNINYKMNLKSGSPEAKMAVWTGAANQAFSTAANTVIAGFNYGLQGKALDAQSAIAGKYYDTQEKIAGYQQTVALRQLDVQETAIFVQQEMHRVQVRSEERLVRLEGATQVRLARVSQDGKTDRARIMSTQDAFSRSGRFMGEPNLYA